MLRLDRNINLCCDYMLRLHVAISCCNQMSIFQLDFPFLLLSISQNWNSAFTIAFLGWISRFRCSVFLKIGDLHFSMHFLLDIWSQNDHKSKGFALKTPKAALALQNSAAAANLAAAANSAVA